MLGLSWTEMLVIAVVVLLAVGPKELPVALRNLGRMMGSVRRMSNEFRREIDKAIAAEEFREARKAISDPLRQTSAEITREFNAIRDNKVVPTGKLKPDEPGKESVYEDIKAKAGLPTSRGEALAAASAQQAKAAPVTAATGTAKAAPRKAAAKTAPAEKGSAKPAAAAKPTSASKAKAPSKSAKTSAKAAPAEDAMPAVKPAAKPKARAKAKRAPATEPADGEG